MPRIGGVAGLLRNAVAASGPKSARSPRDKLTVHNPLIWYLRGNVHSVRQVVGSDGTVLDAITCDSFGNVISETNPAAGDRFKYTGREYDAELSLYYYRARYYDPSSGRFLSEAPSSPSPPGTPTSTGTWPTAQST